MIYTKTLSVNFFKRSYSDLSSLRRTPFYDLHLQYGAKIVDYAGFAMPVVYKHQSHIQSHNWVRERAGLFDVSHMLQSRITGSDATELLEKVTPSDLRNLAQYGSTLSVLLNHQGGIVDDTIITKHGENDFYVVTNAGCREKDVEFFRTEAAGLNVEHQQLNAALLALQGPQAAESLQKLTDFNLSQLYFGKSHYMYISGAEVHVARGGYTGEDGFELSISDINKAKEIAQQLLEDPNVEPVGLAARDSLRLEAGMCLYGHELAENIDPVAARLGWTIGKRRRIDMKFNGASRILEALRAKSGLIRTGLISSGPAARQGAKVTNEEGEIIGEVTSGSMSPTLKNNVAMAYLPRAYSKPGTKVSINIRGKLRPAIVEKMPFVEVKYYREH